MVGGPVQHGHIQGQHEEPVHVERHERAVRVQRTGNHHAQGRQALGRLGAQARPQHVRTTAGVFLLISNYIFITMLIFFVKKVKTKLWQHKFRRFKIC